MTDVPFDQRDHDLRAAVLAAGLPASPAFRADLRARLATQDAHIVRRAAPDTGRRWWPVAAAAAAVLVLAAAVVVLAGRTSEEIGPVTEPDPHATVPADDLVTALVSDVWVAVDFPRAVDLPVLRFKVGTTRPEVVIVNGNSDCNDLSGEFELEGSIVSTSDLTFDWILRGAGCMREMPAVALPSVGASMSISGATLTISEPGAVTEYTALDSLDVADPAELDGDWLLGDDALTITDGVVSSDAPDTLGFVARLRERLAASGVAAWLIDGAVIVDMGGEPGTLWRLERAEPAPPPALVDQLVGRTWVGVDGHWRTAAPTLTFDSLDREPGLLGVAKNDGCNEASGTFRLDGAAVVDADVMGTEIGCEHEVAPVTDGSTLAVTDDVLTVTYDALTLATTYVAVDSLESVSEPDLTGNWRAHGGWISLSPDGVLAQAEIPPTGDASRGLDPAIHEAFASGPAEAWRYGSGWIIGSPSGGFVQLTPDVAVVEDPGSADGETAEGWISTALPGPGGEPIITPGLARHIVEVAGRRLILGTEPSGCCSSSLLAWVDDGDGAWRWIDLDDQFGMSTDEPALLTHGPLDVESNGALAVAVGAIQTTDGDTLASEPRFWVSYDLRAWEEIVVPGLGLLTDVDHSSRGWIAVGTVDDVDLVLASADGRVWERVGTLGPGVLDDSAGPRVASTSGVVFATGSEGTNLESSDGGVTWVAPPSDRGAILDAGEGFVLALRDDAVLGSADGDVWIDLGDPPYAPNEVGSVRAAGDPRSGQVTLTAVDDAGVPTVSTADGGAQVVAPWRDTIVTTLGVGSDGTAMVLTARPPRPSNKPLFALAIWTRPPAGQIERTEVAATRFTATGTARDICTAAGIAANDTGDEFEGVVLDDITTRHDGTELRWLACTGDEASGWGVTVLTSRDDSTWQMTALGLGDFRHAGDGADVSVDGGTGWVRYRSMVRDRFAIAWSVDGGAQWVVTTVVPE